MTEYIKRIADHTGVQADKYFKTTLFHSSTLLLGLNCLEPGQVQAAHTHADQDKFYYVVAGNGRFWLGDNQAMAAAGDVIWAPAGVRHGVENVGDGRLTLLLGIAPAP